MSDKSPCFGCEHAGCGNHANCEAYMAYYARRRAESAERIAKGETWAYLRDTSNKIMKRRNLD